VSKQLGISQVVLNSMELVLKSKRMRWAGMSHKCERRGKCIGGKARGQEATRKTKPYVVG
jgi:hypothetical protein